MMRPRDRFSAMRTILEIPLADDRYWPRIPDIAADAIMLDLEDSVPAESKIEARNRCLDILSRQELFEGKHVFVRVNDITTEWGPDDLIALAGSPAGVMICIPKVESVTQLQSAMQMAVSVGTERDFYVMIESYRGLTAVDDILALPGVVGVHFGYTDYGTGVRCRIFSEAGDDFYGEAMKSPRARIGAAAAHNGLFATGGSLVPEFRDLAKVERFVRSWREAGYTACIALSPRHIEAVTRGIRLSDSEKTHATAIISGDVEATFIDRRLAELALLQDTGR